MERLVDATKPRRGACAGRALSCTALALVLAVLAGCKTIERLADVGDEPTMTNVVNPTARPNYRPVSMPMPAPYRVEDNPNSLWRVGAKAFFKDTRAKDVGDIVIVKITMSDSATWQNKTERDRDDKEDTNVTTILGLEDEFRKKLPQGIDATSIFSFDNRHDTTGEGKITRSETLTLTFAAVVTQVLPNGFLVVHGRQEVRLSYEMRELSMVGIVRPTDIESDNTISHDKIAELRIAYGGRGTISDLQQPRWGLQVWDILFPF
jgi:flagellar L-ring protein precursor FlgH